MEVTLERFEELISNLEKGNVRVAEKKNGVWRKKENAELKN